MLSKRVVESLEELGPICQKPNYREVGNWYARRVIRDAALPITRLLLYTGVTANQVTAISLILGLLGISLFASPSPIVFLLGTFLLQVWYLLDHVDGQIARYRKTSSLTGRFFDFLTHHLIHGVIFFSLGYYGFGLSGISLLVVWGFLASLLMMLFNLLSDTKYKTFFEALSGERGFEIVTSEKTEEVRPTRVKGGILERITSFCEKCLGLVKRRRFRQLFSGHSIKEAFRGIYSFCHKLSEIHVLMNILTVSSLLNLMPTFPIDLRLALLLFYGTTVPLMTLVKIIYWIARGKIDQEFNLTFEETKVVTR